MTAGETLILEATDFIDTQHWRWVLEDSQGKFLADQEVRLDPADPNYSAFIDLEGFLKVNFSSRGDPGRLRHPGRRVTGKNSWEERPQQVEAKES